MSLSFCGRLCGEKLIPHPGRTADWPNNLIVPINASVTLCGQCSDRHSRRARMSQEGVFAPGDALRRADILYVDSDLHRRDAMRRMLLGLGAARVQLAESGKDALNVVAGTPCNLVMVEYLMAPMTGIQLVREIRSVAHYPRSLVPVLVVGDPVGTDVVAAAFQAGANLFLVRPFDAAKLY